MSIPIIGVDVGNFDTKSAQTLTVSGFATYEKPQLLAEASSLFYNGKCYVESIDSRFPFVEDKTIDNQCFILTLFSIAKEIIMRIRREATGNAIQEEIYKYNVINLGVGLPPGHFSNLAKKMQDYYVEKMQGGVNFTFANYNFSIKLNAIRVYPQDIAAALVNKNNTITTGKDKVKKYYVIGIGGFTVDIAPVVEDVPSAENCRSLHIGTRQMFETIIARIQTSAGITLEEPAIEDVLRKRKVFIKDNVKKEIFEIAGHHASQIIDKCIQAGCALDQYPVIFVGGGGLLLQEYLVNNSKLCYCEFIEDVHANASSYEAIMKAENQQAS